MLELTVNTNMLYDATVFDLNSKKLLKTATMGNESLLCFWLFHPSFQPFAVTGFQLI